MKKILFTFLLLIVVGSLGTALCISITHNKAEEKIDYTDYHTKERICSHYYKKVDSAYRQLHNGPDTLLTLQEVLDFAETNKPTGDLAIYLDTSDYYVGKEWIWSFEAFDTIIYGIEYISTEPNAKDLRQKYNK